jgi:hypothetical protein
VITYSVGVPVAVMNLIVLGFEPDLAACKRRKFCTPTAVVLSVRTGRGIGDQQERSHEREEKDGRGEDSSGRPTFNQGSDEDSTNTLCRLVESLSGTDWKGRVLVGRGSKG